MMKSEEKKKHWVKRMMKRKGNFWQTSCRVNSPN